jgi:hypothetical protein
LGFFIIPLRVERPVTIVRVEDETTTHNRPSNDDEILIVVSPLISRLRFQGTPTQTADDILALVVDAHSVVLDEIVIPQLIEALRTVNEDLRLRIRRVLSGLQRIDYPDNAADELADAWVPAKGESAVDIDRHVQAWQAWWRAVHAANSGRTVKSSELTDAPHDPIPTRAPQRFILIPL